MVKWSISAINSLRRCNRQYYFAHIASSHGRKNKFRREAYELKKMQNLRMWPGSVVDKFIETRIIPYIQELEREDFSQLAEEAVHMAEKQYHFSKNKWYQDPNIKKTDYEDQFAILQIHKLNQSYNQADLDKVYNEIRDSINNFPDIYIPKANQYLLEYLKDAGWKKSNIMNWPFPVNEFKVFSQIDLLLFYNNRPVVIDWKVSQSLTSDYSKQLLVCGLTVKHWNKKKVKQNGGQPFDLESFTLMEVNLWNQSVKYHEFNREKANQMIDYIYLTGSDLELLLNGRKFNEISIEEFDLTDKDTTCNMCNFKTLCREILKENYSL